MDIELQRERPHVLGSESPWAVQLLVALGLNRRLALREKPDSRQKR